MDYFFDGVKDPTVQMEADFDNLEREDETFSHHQGTEIVTNSESVTGGSVPCEVEDRKWDDEQHRSTNYQKPRPAPSIKKISGRRIMNTQMVLNKTWKESFAFARDKIFTVTVFFAMQLWNPPGGVNSDGFGQAKHKISYKVFRVATLLFLATSVAILVIWWKPKSLRAQRQQMKIFQILLVIGAAMLFTAHVAGYFIVNGNPFV